MSRVTFTHERLKSRDDVRDPEAHKKVRTDHTTATLDRFLKKGSATLRSDLHATRDKVAVPQKIVSVRKLIYAFEQDVDQTLQNLFKKHSYVGMVTLDQVLLQFETKLILCQTYPVL